VPSTALRDRIVQSLAARGYVPIYDLLASFRVRPRTLRADLNCPAYEGRLLRHHCGDSMPSGVANIADSARRAEFARNKALIA
jgi:DeoR/GlpR family transcriptional regulator of sugar metabolism